MEGDIMLKIKYDSELFMFIMEHCESVCNDVYGGYLYLNCTEERLKNIRRAMNYYNRTRAGK